VIIYLIKVCKSANLLAKLWPETMLMVIYLYNCSLLDACLKDNNEMISPNEMLTNWFYNYF
jgi:hypothetical protein